MTIFKTTTAMVAAFSLFSVSTVASAQPAASKLSIAVPARAGAKAGKKNDVIATGLLIGILAAAAVVAGVVVIADDNSTSG